MNINLHSLLHVPIGGEVDTHEPPKHNDATAVKMANMNYAALHNMKYAAIDYYITSLYCDNQIM